MEHITSIIEAEVKKVVAEAKAKFEAELKVIVEERDEAERKRDAAIEETLKLRANLNAAMEENGELRALVDAERQKSSAMDPRVADGLKEMASLVPKSVEEIDAMEARIAQLERQRAECEARHTTNPAVEKKIAKEITDLSTRVAALIEMFREAKQGSVKRVQITGAKPRAVDASAAQ